MEWDQYLFYLGHKLFKKAKQKWEKPSPYYLFCFADQELQIRKFILIVRGWVVPYIPTKNRIALDSSSIRFPERLRLLETEENSRGMVYCLVAFLVSKDHGSGEVPKDEKNSGTKIYPKILRILKEYPGLKTEWTSVTKALRNLRKVDPKHYQNLKALVTEVLVNNSSTAEPIDHSGSRDFQSEKKSNKVETKESEQILDLESAEILEVDEKKIEEYTLGHNFEKIETVEEFDGQWRDIDGEEDMDEEEALQELNLKHVIRTEDPVHTTRSTESGGGTKFEIGPGEHSTIAHTYPEWDYRKQIYRENYCSVLEEFHRSEERFYTERVYREHSTALEMLQRKLRILVNERRIIRRLPSGSDIDLDALVARQADLHAKVTPSDNVYTNPIRDISDIGLYFLMDLSLSTDSWIDGQRVLDVERDSLILFSKCLEELGIPFGIGGFYSRTHNHCKFVRIKEFAETWAKTQNRLGTLSPIGYTRIGSALRHAQSIQSKENNRQKWIILLTDSCPNDYDQYEGKYGVEDVHRAVRECLQAGIRIHTLSIGREEKPTIPAMMREASYQMLGHPNRLIDSLQDFFRRAIVS